MMSRLIAKGIIKSYSMRERRIAAAAAAVKPPNGIVSNCYVFVVDSCLMHSVTCM